MALDNRARIIGVTKMKLVIDVKGEAAQAKIKRILNIYPHLTKSAAYYALLMCGAEKIKEGKTDLLEFVQGGPRDQAL